MALGSLQRQALLSLRVRGTPIVGQSSVECRSVCYGCNALLQAGINVGYCFCFLLLFFSLFFFLLPVHVVDSKGLLLINQQQSLNYDSGGATIEIAGYVHTG